MDDPIDAAENAINQQRVYGKIIQAELILTQGDKLRMAKFIGRTVGPDGKTVGTFNDTPIFNLIVYDVEFPDGEFKEYAANIIAENMLSQVENEGFTFYLLDSILDFNHYEQDVSKDDQYATTKRGSRRLSKTTCGWKLLVQWKDGNESCIPLKDLKESHPVESAEFAKAHGIATDPDFIWWVPHTLQKRDVIILSVKYIIRRTTYKYGIEIPTSLEHARKLDKANGNDFWRKAIEKEMMNVGISFEVMNARS